jgi:hypothetical protein
MGGQGYSIGDIIGLSYGVNEDGDLIFYKPEAINMEICNILDSLPVTFSSSHRVSYADLIRGDVVHVERNYCGEAYGPCVVLGFEQGRAISVMRKENSWKVISFPDYWRITLLDNIDVDQNLDNILASVVS